MGARREEPAHKNKHASRRVSLRARAARGRLRLLGGAAVAGTGALIALVFLAASISPMLMRSHEVAAVVSGVLADLANGDRASGDLATLTVNPLLVEAAQKKADDMASKGYFAHTSPDGVEPWHWFKEVGYAFDYAGENLAVNFSDSGDVNSAWMASPTHRDNILNPHYTEIGVATAVGTYKGREAIFVVQEFGTPAGTTLLQREKEIAVVPTRANKPALASAPKTQVLGASSQADVAGAQQPTPLWAYLVGFPHEALRIAYLVLGVLIAAALAYTTRFEMKKHHLRHAGAAAILIGLMCTLFIAANYFVFTEPVLAAIAASV